MRQWREGYERVSLREALGVTRKLLAILEACHEAGLMLRDVTPENIILADGDPARPILLDFGLRFRKDSEIYVDTEDG